MNQTELLDKIDHLLKEEVEHNAVTYNAEVPYQSYERIGFQGLRWSVERRISEYGLSQYFNPSNRVLDIGSNFGFFVCEFALHCSHVDGVEPNRHLNTIGEITAEYLGVADKTTFFDQSFESFIPSQPYDVVLSLAAFFTQDGRERSSAEQYFGKIFDILVPGGQLFYESTSYSRNSQTAARHLVAADDAIASIEQRFTSVKVWETPSGSPGFFRRFCVATKQ